MFFFFQAEDGIRDLTVTGVQTCALPISTFPLVSEGKVVGTITAIDDVSERVVRESELVAAREEADKANAAKDRFLAVLSHDLRTPLTSILGWARIFRNQPDEEAIRKGAEVIERNAGVQLQL